MPRRFLDRSEMRWFAWCDQPAQVFQRVSRLREGAPWSRGITRTANLKTSVPFIFTNWSWFSSVSPEGPSRLHHPGMMSCSRRCRQRPARIVSIPGSSAAQRRRHPAPSRRHTGRAVGESTKRVSASAPMTSTLLTRPDSTKSGSALQRVHPLVHGSHEVDRRALQPSLGLPSYTPSKA